MTDEELEKLHRKIAAAEAHAGVPRLENKR